MNEIADWLATLAADVLHREPFDVSSPFVAGHHDADATSRLTAEIMRRRNLSVPDDIVDRYPSPALLAEWMYCNADRIYEPMIQFRGSGRTKDAPENLFCMHPVSGVGTVFKKLSSYLRPQLRTFAFQARGLNPGETPPASFDQMVSDYSDRITEISEGIPPHLLGWSFGGHIAQAIAIELQRRGHPTGLLILIDSWIAHEALAERPPPLPTYDEYLRDKYELLLPDELSALESMDEDGRLRMIVKKLVELEAFRETARQMPLTTVKRILAVGFRLEAMFRRQRPKPYSGPTLLVSASDNKDWGYDVVAQWQHFASRLSVEHLAYPHVAMLVKDESVSALSAIVARHCASFAGADVP